MYIDIDIIDIDIISIVTSWIDTIFNIPLYDIISIVTSWINHTNSLSLKGVR